MKLVFRIKTKLFRMISEPFFRKKRELSFRSRLKNDNFTIISSNCIGGIMYSSLGKKFLSPTINLSMDSESFISFLENMEHYLNSKLEFLEIADGEEYDFGQIKGYPIGKIDDIKIHFVHYKSFEDAEIKWNERKKRINFENMFVVMSDKDNCTDEIIDRYSKINYPKVFYTHRPVLKYDFMCYVPGFEKENEVGVITRYSDFSGNRYFEKYFDFVNWINTGVNK